MNLVWQMSNIRAILSLMELVPDDKREAIMQEVRESLIAHNKAMKRLMKSPAKMAKIKALAGIDEDE